MTNWSHLKLELSISFSHTNLPFIYLDGKFILGSVLVWLLSLSLEYSLMSKNVLKMCYENSLRTMSVSLIEKSFYVESSWGLYIKTFYSRNLVFVSVKPFQPSLMFASKAKMRTDSLGVYQQSVYVT